MTEPGRRFDYLSTSYEELLKDPIRDRFSAGSQFFHLRKRDLIQDYFRARGLNAKAMSCLDLGCGKGELLRLLLGDFASVAGCDPSSGMLEAGGLAGMGIDARVQADPIRIPFAAATFDSVIAVCVYHHVPPADRAALTAEVGRVLRPSGIVAIIEHNPYNPATRLIVSRTPMDADAILLRPAESRRLLSGAGLSIDEQTFFLYLPEKLYERFGAIERALACVPLGGQYAVFARKPVTVQPPSALAGNDPGVLAQSDPPLAPGAGR